MLSSGIDDGSGGELAAAIEALLDEPLGETLKGMPFGSQISARTIADQGWNLFSGDLPLPIVALDPAAVDHNIRLMQSFADANGALLAPHGKTTMAPQIWADQLAAGAWAITVATAAQLQVAAAFGVARVIYANEPVTEYEFRLLAGQLNAGRDVYALVDDPTSAGRLAAGLAHAGAQRPLPVLVELGVAGGRTGTRDADAAYVLGRLVRSQLPELRLAGVESFEATASALAPDDPVGAVDRVLVQLLEAATRLMHDIGATQVPSGDFLVSAGGSAFFDRVVDVLGGRLPAGSRLVLRPGTYVTHDSGLYDGLSPMGHGAGLRGSIGELRSALTLWAAVLSRPEPDLAIINAGRRDSPADADAPRPFWHVASGSMPLGASETPGPFPGHGSVFAANDQHMYMRVEPASPLMPGDVIGFGISHPCLVMDRWRVVPLVTRTGSVVGAVRTFF